MPIEQPVALSSSSVAESLDLMTEGFAKSVERSIARALSEYAESTTSSIESSSENMKKLIESRITRVTQQSEVMINEALEEFERNLKSRIENISDGFERRVQTTRQKLETAADSQLQSEFKKRIETVKQDLNKALNTKLVEFSEQTKSIVRGLSSDLKENAERSASEARGEFDVLVKGAAKELQDKLSKMSDGVMLSHLTNTRGVLNELRRLNAKHEEVQSILHEISSRTEQLETATKASSSSISNLRKRFKAQMTVAQQSIQAIDTFIIETEKEIADLQQHGQEVLQKARTTIEQRVPEETQWAIAEGRTQAMLKSKAETAKETHLVLGGLYAELRLVEREVRTKLETVKAEVEEQKRSVVSAVKQSGDKSLSEWVSAILSS
jgi:predicted  nucleic acid-binding Zn-ribbon protein